MEIITNPARDTWRNLVRRNIPADDARVTATVEEVVRNVQLNGDEALRRYAREFDGLDATQLMLTESEIEEGAAKVAPAVREAIQTAARNIELFHAAQMPREVEVETMPGVRCLQRAVPIRRVGLYVPGGRAPLFSTVLMLGIPARIAGCREVVLCTPQSGESGIAPEILLAAKVCGISRIFRIGGAQAIAAMAYGTESVPKVGKIFGPGNRYVTKAKQLVSAVTAIDMPAGPSEVMVMADGTANPAYVAADLLSQAEHGPDSQAVLLCTDRTIADKVLKEIENQLRSLTRTDSIQKSLSQSRAVVMPDRGEMVEFANAYAAEHLIISMRDPWEVAAGIDAAGSVFIGHYSPESAGDYASGTNHTLPTGGWARSHSGVNLDSFMHRITYQELTRTGLESLAPTITAMATAEGLDAHANAVHVRIAKDEL